jgi:hypothetical protein
MEKKYIIDEALLQSVAQYLYARPMVEVEGLVNKIRNLSEYVEPKQSELAEKDDAPIAGVKAK